MEFCPTMEMIGEYLTKELHGYQLCRFRHIIIGIHEYDIPYYNAS